MGGGKSPVGFGDAGAARAGDATRALWAIMWSLRGSMKAGKSHCILSRAFNPMVKPRFLAFLEERKAWIGKRLDL